MQMTQTHSVNIAPRSGLVVQNAGPWGIHILARDGAPPYRVSARKVYERTGPYGSCITLWEMRKARIALQYSVPDVQGVTREVVCLDTLQEAIAHLEGVCAELAVLQDPTFATDTEQTFWSLLMHRQRAMASCEGFLNLVARVLYDWDETEQHVMAQ